MDTNKIERAGQLLRKGYAWKAVLLFLTLVIDGAVRTDPESVLTVFCQQFMTVRA